MSDTVAVASSALLAATFMMTNIWVWERGQAAMCAKILKAVSNVGFSYFLDKFHFEYSNTNYSLHTLGFNFLPLFFIVLIGTKTLN